MELGERFWSKVDVRGEDECWSWTGRPDPSSGYGAYEFNRKKNRPHRLVMIEKHGAIPSRLYVDHICRNRICVNPVHLQLVPQALNCQNRGNDDPRSTTGARNVYWSKDRKGFVAKVNLNYKQFYLGCYPTKEEATAVAIAWRRENYSNSVMDQMEATG